MTPNLYLVRMNRNKRGKNAERYFERSKFLPGQWQEAGIVESRGARRLGDRASKRCDGHGVADAAAKLMVKRVCWIMI